MDKSGSASNTETEHTVKPDTKKGSLPLASSDDKNMEEQEPKRMMIKTNKSAHDDQSCSTITVSLDGDRIPSRKKKINHQKLQSQRIK